MSAFIIFHSTVNDPELFQTYAKAVGPTLQPFQGEVVLRGHSAATLDGVHDHQNVGVLKFPDRAAALEWYRSEAYQALIDTRNQAAQMEVVCYDEPM